MSCFIRVHKLNQIPVLNEQGHPIDTFTVSGRMVLPMSIERPAADARQPAHRYYLSISLGELAYLHEQIPVA